MAETPDPRDAEIGILRQQVTNLSEALARVSQLATTSSAGPEPSNRPPGFVMLSNGQVVRAPMTDQDVQFIRGEGFHWDGNTPVFPPHWPALDPKTGEKATLI